MVHMSRFPWLGRFRPLLLISLFYLSLSLLLRLILWKFFGTHAEVSWADIPTILATGLVNDAVVLIFLNLPASIYLTLLPDRFVKRRWHLVFFGMLLFISLFSILYLAGVEFFFFQEFDARFNLVAVDYLIYPHEVFVNIWESYPVGRIILFDAVVAGLILSRLWSKITPVFQISTRFRQRFLVLTCHLLLLGPALLLSTDSLDLSANRVSRELAHNGVSSLFRSFRTNHLDYNAYYRTLDKPKAFQLVRSELNGDGAFISKDQENLARKHAARPNGFGRLNVVVIVEESFSASFSHALGGSKDLTPFLDRLSKEGMLFTRAYASGTRTVRGLEAISTSFPPIPSEAILKRPGNENIANWGKVMQNNGYHTSFLYGGYGTFDNMNYFFSSNEFAISDRTEIADPKFTNIWGVSDGDLFRHALGYYDDLDQKGKPFFSIVMSTSNHSPYTFPKGLPGIPAEGGGRKAGVRYADYALGRFFDEARNHPWFDQTLFVVVADHCARVYGRAEVPVGSYHIPLLFYAPGKIQPALIDRPIGQIDIAPTVLGMLGLPYTAPFYGRDVFFDNDLPDQHPLFLNHNHDVAMMVGDRLAVLGLHQSAHLYRYDRNQTSMTQLPDNPQMFDRAAAIYQTAFDLFTRHRYQ
jgi:phosphoglycerol transferase MdoB-like AlkP superfamily enzyme